MSDAVVPTKAYTTDDNRKIPQLNLAGIHKKELPRFSARTTAEIASPDNSWWKQQTSQTARDPTATDREGVKEGVIYTVLYPKYREGPQMQAPTFTPQRRRAAADKEEALQTTRSHGAGVNPDGSNNGFASLPLASPIRHSTQYPRRRSFASASKDVLRGGTDGRLTSVDPFAKKHMPLAIKVTETKSPSMEYAGCCEYGLVRWTDDWLRKEKDVGMWRDGTAAVTWSGKPVPLPMLSHHPTLRESQFDRAAHRPSDPAEARRRQKIAAFIDAQDAIQRRRIPKTPGCCPSSNTIGASIGGGSTHFSVGQSSKQSSKQTSKQGSITFSLPADTQRTKVRIGTDTNQKLYGAV